MSETTRHRHTLERPIRGRFDLRQSAAFGFGHTVATTEPAVRLAFVVDGYAAHAGALVTQPTARRLRLDLEISGEVEVPRVVEQVERILGTDVDATGYDALVDADPLLRRVWSQRPGLRPVSFHSAYEALLWSILSARRPAAAMARVRDDLAAAHGASFEVGGVAMHAAPTPQRLLQVADFAGVPEVKLRRLHAVAEAAAEGEVDTAALRARPAEEVAAQVRGFEGIGPFYSELVTVRALGHTDVPPTAEPRTVRATSTLVGRDLDAEGFAAALAAWRPWRTWACVAIRAAAGGSRP